MADKRLNVVIAGDSSQLSRAFSQIEGQAGSFGSKFDAIGNKMASVGRTLTTTVTAPIIGLGAVSFKAASDLNESMSKANAVFGESGRAVQAWSQTTASSIGLSRNEALGAVGTFGNMFNQLGVGAEESRKMSTRMVELAADFASFHNADITEVIDAQSAAFRGEYDSLQRFLPLINAASVEQKAMAMTGKTNAKELTAQEKALAVNALMMEGAGKAAGDFARTSDGAANKQRIMKAEFQDAAATIGTQLLPIGQRLLTFLGGLLEKFQNLSPGTQDMIIKIAGLAAVIGPALIAGGKLVRAFDDIGKGFMVLTEIMKKNPWLLLIAAVIALVVLIVTHWDKIKSYLSAAWNWIKDTASTAWENIKQTIGDKIAGVINWVRDLPGRIAGFFSNAWQWLKNAGSGLIQGLINGVADKLGDLWDWIKSIPRNLGNFFSRAWEWLKNAGKDIITGVWNGLVERWNWLLDKLRELKDNFVGWFRHVFGARSPARVMISLGRDIAAGMEVGMTKGIPGIMRAAQGMAGAAVPNVGDVALGAFSGGAVGALTGGAVVNNYITVEGSVIRENQLLDAVQSGLLQRKNRGATLGF